MARLPESDWSQLEAEYRANLLTDTALAGKYKVSRESIRKRAKRDGWTRDLSAVVRTATKAAMVRNAAIRDAEARRAVLDDKINVERATVEAAVADNMSVIRSHQALAERLKSIAGDLTEELANVSGMPEKIEQLIAAVAQEDPLAAQSLARAMSMGNRIKALDTLAAAVTKTIAAERVARGLDESGSQGGGIEELLAELGR